MTSNLGRLAWIAVCLGAGCADWSRGPAPLEAPNSVDGRAVDEGAPNADAPPSFAGSIHQLLSAACQGCHAPGKQAGDTQFLLTGDPSADYPTVSRLISTSAPATSRLLAKMAGGGHGGGTVFAATSPEYQSVLRWIQEGARP
jgi:mono/diheme cytochrome c family protein